MIVTKNFKKIPEWKLLWPKRYDQKQEDIEQWLKITNWSQKQISVSGDDKSSGTAAGAKPNSQKPKKIPIFYPTYKT